MVSKSYQKKFEVDRLNIYDPSESESTKGLRQSHVESLNFKSLNNIHTPIAQGFFERYRKRILCNFFCLTIPLYAPRIET